MCSWRSFRRANAANTVSFRPCAAALVVAVAAEQLQELQRRLPRGGRIQDAQMRGAEHRIELPLAAEIDRRRPGEERAAGEIVRLAVAVFGGHTGQRALPPGQVDEIRAPPRG